MAVGTPIPTVPTVVADTTEETAVLNLISSIVDDAVRRNWNDRSVLMSRSTKLWMTPDDANSTTAKIENVDVDIAGEAVAIDPLNVAPSLISAYPATPDPSVSCDVDGDIDPPNGTE